MRDRPVYAHFLIVPSKRLNEPTGSLYAGAFDVSIKISGSGNNYAILRQEGQIGKKPVSFFIIDPYVGVSVE